MKEGNNISVKALLVAVSALFLVLISYLLLEPKLDVLSAINSIDNQEKPNIYKENYSDSASQAVLISSNSEYVFAYEKSTLIDHAFAGAYFPLDLLFIDFTDYDEIEIDLKSKKGKRIPVQLSLHYGDSLVRYLTAYIDLEYNKISYKLNISDFKTPAEWFEKNNLNKAGLPVTSFDKIRTITIESCHLLGKGIEDEITISKITFGKNNTTLFIQLTVGYLLLMAIFFILDRRKKLKQASIVRMPIVPQDIEKGIESIDKITQYISHNYSNADLKIGDIQKTVGIHHKKIAEELNLKFELSFPQYLALVRIDEAKRLLLNEPDISISEIGFMVGFNTPNNFNRVFKKLENVTPSQFRGV